MIPARKSTENVVEIAKRTLDCHGWMARKSWRWWWGVAQPRRVSTNHGRSRIAVASPVRRLPREPSAGPHRSSAMSLLGILWGWKFWFYVEFQLFYIPIELKFYCNKETLRLLFFIFHQQSKRCSTYLHSVMNIGAVPRDIVMENPSRNLAIA